MTMSGCTSRGGTCTIYLLQSRPVPQPIPRREVTLMPRWFDSLSAPFRKATAPLHDRNAIPAWGRVVQVTADGANGRWPDLGKYTEQAKFYSQSSAFYIAIDRKATAGALVNLNVLRLEGERPIAQINPPPERPPRRPHSWETQY